MSTLSPTRPSRRAAARKRVIVEESDDNSSPTLQKEDEIDDGDDFTPAPQQSPRRKTRRKATDPLSTPLTAVRSRRARAREGAETSQTLPRRGRVSVAMDPPPPLQTPKPSATPEASKTHGTPLADITDATINEQVSLANTQKDILPVRPMDLVLEKPMDIVVRSRALAAPSVPEPVGPRARTVIKYLVLTNFKSYAGRQEVGPFHASFSSVVGPNGSGKSNVIDSLLFVFGFRASKMRQGKISALIHNSAAFPNLDFCEVEVHFEEVMDLVRCSNLTSHQYTNILLAKRNAGNNSRLNHDNFSKGFQK